jgi:cell pole-organizing protein PopZ
MSDPKNQEPSMEEILASIRRIIAEDADAAPKAEAEAEVSLPDLPAALVPEPPPAPSPVMPFMEAEADDDILELTEIVPDEPPPPPEPPPMRMPEPVSWPEPEPLFEPEPERFHRESLRDRLVSDSTAAVSSATMAGLANQLGRRRSDVYLSDRAVTLEEITKDVLRPMLQSWLDENLPGIVERLVREEIQRIARDAL